MSRLLNAEQVMQQSAKNRAAWGQPAAPLVAPLTAEHGNGGARPLFQIDTDLLGRYDLPYPPTINTYWRNLGEGRTVLSRGAREYRKAVMELIGAAVPVRDRLRIEIELYPPDKRRRDLDNVTKSLFDCMQHAHVFHDDSQIDEYRIKRMPVVAGGRCVVTMYLMKG